MIFDNLEMQRNLLIQVALRIASVNAASPGARDNLPRKVHLFCAHDVAVAYRLAMAKVWVRLPLGALSGYALVVQWLRLRCGMAAIRVQLSSSALSPGASEEVSVTYSDAAVDSTVPNDTSLQTVLWRTSGS